MNLILLEPGECGTDGQVCVDGRRARHILQVLDARPGDTLRVGQINGLAGSGEVTALGRDTVQLVCRFDQLPPAKLPLTVILALPRPKVLRRVLRTVTELGIAELWLINSWKVDKSYWQSPALEPAACRDALLEGLEQARDTVLPDIHCRRLFKPFVEDELAGVIRGRALVAQPGAPSPCPHSLTDAATLLIGPEGGLTDYEYRRVQEYGFQGVHFGQRILRVETALIALTSRLFQPL